MISKNMAGEISFLEAGSSGPPIIFLHALVGSATSWEPQLTDLSDEFLCIAWDMPGFGDSSEVSSDSDMDEIVATLHRFVDQQLGLRKAHFAGLSLGGMILQHFAAVHPEMCRSLAILDSSPKFGFSGDMRPEEFVDPLLERLAAGVTIEELSAELCAAMTGSSCSKDTLAACIGGMSRARRSGLQTAVRLVGAHDALEKLPAIACPVLAMVGAEDNETPIAYAAEIASRVQRGSLSIIPDAGHISNLESPETVTTQLRVFFRQAFDQ